MMKYYLSNTDYQNINSALKRYGPENFDLRDELGKWGIWDPQIIHEVGERLLDEPLSEDQTRAFHNWGHFLFFSTVDDPKFTNLPGWGHERMLISEKVYGLGQAFRFCFGFAKPPCAIPYELWSDLAPHMLSEVKRFYASQNVSYDKFSLTLNWDVVQDRKKMFKSNPETDSILEAWRDSLG